MTDHDERNARLREWADLQRTYLPDSARTTLVIAADVLSLLANEEQLRRERDALGACIPDETMAVYRGELLHGENCPSCGFPCDERFTAIMGIGEGKVAHLMCAYRLTRMRADRAEAELRACAFAAKGSEGK